MKDTTVVKPPKCDTCGDPYPAYRIAGKPMCAECERKRAKAMGAK